MFLFCVSSKNNCGATLFMGFIVMANGILKYFSDVFSYLEIIGLLSQLHDFQTNLSTLKRWLREPVAIVRSSNEELWWAVQEELNNSVSRVGYCRVHRPIVRKGLVVKKHDIRLLVKELEGVVLRKRRCLYRLKYSNPGLSFTGRDDGYEELKYYGFGIDEYIGCF